MRSLRVQLIATLLLVALVPAIPAYFTVSSLFRRTLEPGIEPVALEGLRAGLEATRDLLDGEKRAFLDAMGTPGEPDASGGRGIQGATETLGADRIAALSDDERAALAPWVEAAALPNPADGVLHGPLRARIDGRDHLVAAIARDRTTRIVVRPLPEALVDRAAAITTALRTLETTRRERAPVTRSLIATFVAVYGVVLVLVMGLGLLLASRLTRPLRDLAGGIDRVAGGDLTTRVDEGAGGEMGRLQRQFNAMVGRLDHQQTELLRLEKIAVWRQLARRLAHEIKNPLTPIRLAAEQMRDAYAGEDPEYRALLNEGASIVEEEVGALRNLVREFSEFARLPEPSPVVAAPATLAADIAALYGDRVRLDVPAGLPTVLCDPERIHRVLINLVNNALAAQEDTGSTEPVAVEAGPNGDGVRFRVLDRGPGVPPSDRRRIFEPDFTTRSEGMGLGLAIVKETMRAHGSTIAVEDRSGGGAVFRFDLPRATSPGDSPAGDGSRAPGDSPGSNPAEGTERP